MKDMDVGYIERDRYGVTEMVVFRKTERNSRATLAMALIERWALVAAKEDGEDSAGRQNPALTSPVELVELACQIADLTITEFEHRGWLLDLPGPIREKKT